MQPVKAVLLATSETNKLAPLTETMPAPMVPVVNRPVMAYVVELLARQGVKEIVVSVYHLAGQIEAYFGNGRRWGVSLEYALQGQALGSAGSLKWARSLLPETFIVLPGDGLLELDISAAVAHHQEQRCAVTVIERSFPEGGFEKSLNDSPGSLTETGAAPEIGAAPETGAYIMNAEVLELIPQRTPFDIGSQLIPAVTRAGGAVSCFEMSGYGNRLESFSDYLEAQRTLLGSKLNGSGRQTTVSTPSLSYFSIDGRKFGEGVWVGRNQVIHPTARLTPPVYIGDNTFIGSEVELGPEAVIGSNVVIDDEATIKESAILDGTYVGQLVNVEQRLVHKNLIIDLETADFTRVTDDFLLGQAYRADLDRGFQRVVDFWAALLLLGPAAILALVPALLLLLTTGRVFARVERQFNRPRPGGDVEEIRFQLFQFNVWGKGASYHWLGRMMARFEIERWPELLNLLKGDLTLVGVKALSPEEVGRLNEAWHQPRHERRPGLTGLWYTNTGRDSELDECVVADLYYLATRNWREELKILLRTPLSWLKRAGS